MDEVRAVASQFLFAEPVIWLQRVGLSDSSDLFGSYPT